MDYTKSLVTNSSVFRGMDQKLLEQELLTKGRVKKYTKGSYLLIPQQVQDHFAIILKGKIHTQHLFADGYCSILDVLEEWELFGADLICTKSRITPYHAVAATDLELLIFPWYLPFTPVFLIATVCSSSVYSSPPSQLTSAPFFYQILLSYGYQGFLSAFIFWMISGP